jgi:SAM-dependent methyltransferase
MHAHLLSAAPRRCLVIGCGTSMLSEDLHALEFGEIVSIDNDADCIRFMKDKCKDKPALKWIVADLISGTGIPANKSDLNDDGFDLIIDKGTFDAILVEGTVSPMLAQVHRMLKPEGAYVIGSLNSEQLLGHLLAPKLIGWTMALYSADERTRIAICNNKSPCAVDWTLVGQEEIKSLNTLFKTVSPLLTPELETSIRSKFSSPLSFKDAHQAVFISLLPSLCYDLPLFMDDLKRFKVSSSGNLSADEIISFISAMQ